MTNNRQAFIASVVLHSIAIGVLALFIFIDPLRAEEKPIVLELVSLPDETPAPDAPTPPTPTTPTVEEFKVSESQHRKLPDINIPEPQPEAPPPAPKPPEPVVTPKPIEKPKPKAEPKPEPPKPKMTSFKDFQKNHDMRPSTPTPPKPRSSTVAPQIKTNKISIQPSQIAPSTAAANSSVVASYQKRLRDAIELNWDRPVSGSGNEYTEIRFRVFSNGSIGEIKIVRSNGPSAFVSSVRTAVATQVSIGARPQGWDGLMTITFRLR
ncbi:TonB C-terminal domain-containing protein [Cerasicoccus maritimus]|uniref:TonB C-terminal domain-containing protein n=1 Tax=Cerasicoccus maritimus TaxID=490089 RepID=UPI002852741B|nr:TonB C-terminal domain-containing protein [Cerasicoccus maritimus]